MNLFDDSFVVYLSTSCPSILMHPHPVLIWHACNEGCVGCMLCLRTMAGEEKDLLFLESLSWFYTLFVIFK